MALAQPNRALLRSSLKADHLKQRQGSDDLLLSSDPYYDYWYEVDENSEPILPHDFSERLGIHLIVLMEKHTTVDAVQKISEIFDRHIVNQKMYIILLKTLRLFLARTDLANYHSILWQALLSGRKLDSVRGSLLEEMLAWFYQDFKTNRQRNHFADPSNSNVSFSFIAAELGDNFINLFESHNKNQSYVRQIFAMLINLSLFDLDINEEVAKIDSMILKDAHQASENMPYYERYIFNDIYQYVEYRASNLGQKDYISTGSGHSPETIKILLRNLNSVRSQTIQASINEKLLKRDEEIRASLDKRYMTDEEFVISTPLFSELLKLFYMDRRTYFDTRGIELVRIFSRIIGVMLGFFVVIYSFLDPDFMSLYESFSVFLTMLLYTQLVYSQRFFQPMYPLDYGQQLNTAFRNYFQYFQKMNKEQLLAFCDKQIKARENRSNYFLIPEILIRLHDYFPSKKQKKATYDDIYGTAGYIQQTINESL